MTPLHKDMSRSKSVVHMGGACTRRRHPSYEIRVDVHIGTEDKRQKEERSQKFLWHSVNLVSSLSPDGRIGAAPNACLMIIRGTRASERKDRPTNLPPFLPSIYPSIQLHICQGRTRRSLAVKAKPITRLPSENRNPEKDGGDVTTKEGI